MSERLPRHGGKATPSVRSPDASTCFLSYFSTGISDIKSDVICNFFLQCAVPTVEPIAQAPPVLEPEQMPADPTLWTIDNVISHLSYLDSALGPHVEMFRSHEIDGNALLLLTSDMMMKYMGMKLGPALKICNIINMIQGKKHQPLPK